jgi:putative hydrolase of the HAD superfamily
MMNAVLFDLDNTLYDSEEYFLGAFKAISSVVSEKYHVAEMAVYKSLVKIWKKKTSMYPHLFNDLLSAFQIDESELQNLVEIFNKYDGIIGPYNDTIPTLSALRKKGYQLGLVTDGNPERQARKVRILGIRTFFETIVYTTKIEPKPSSAAYLTALKKLKVGPSETCYVGDNPLIDFEGAKKVGITTIRILRGEFSRLPKNEFIDFEIRDLKKTIRIVRGCEKSV